MAVGDLLAVVASLQVHRRAQLQDSGGSPWRQAVLFSQRPGEGTLVARLSDTSFGGRPLTEETSRDAQTGAPARGRAPTVANLASFADHVTCPTATLGFAAGVDFDTLLSGTGFDSPFGQTPFAFARGTQFERRVKEDPGNGECKYGPLLVLLRDELGYDINEVRTVNLRALYTKDKAGLAKRAQHTRMLLAKIASGDPQAPNLIDGAVLSATVAGRAAFYETDGIAFRLGEQMRIIEIKSFPVIDGQGDPQAVGSALDQGALYVLLVRRTLAQDGIDPRLVSDELVLICPRNVGLTPGLWTRQVTGRISRMELLLSAAPALEDIDELVAAEADSFEQVRPGAGQPKDRIHALARICEQIGTSFADSCQGCGLYRFCRERAFAEDAVAIGGAQLERELAGITSLRRAADLATGANPTPAEAPAAEQLVRMRRLREQARARSAA